MNTHAGSTGPTASQLSLTEASGLCLTAPGPHTPPRWPSPHPGQLSAQGSGCAGGSCSFWQLGPGPPELLPHCSCHPNGQEKDAEFPLRFSVQTGLLSLCHWRYHPRDCKGSMFVSPEAAASWQTVPRHSMERHLPWSHLAVWCRGGLARPRQGFQRAFHMGSRPTASRTLTQDDSRLSPVRHPHQMCRCSLLLEMLTYPLPEHLHLHKGPEDSTRFRAFSPEKIAEWRMFSDGPLFRNI